MVPQYDVALADFREGIGAWRLWGRLGWQGIKRRYRRTTIGSFWTTANLGLFVFSLGLVWAHLWGQDPKTYLPFLCAGMLAWNLISSIITDGCVAFISAESFIKGFRLPFTLLSCAVVWRSLIVNLRSAGFWIIVVTNQPDIGNGLVALTEVEAMHARLRAKLPVDAIEVCPHRDGDGCGCRKPALDCC